MKRKFSMNMETSPVNRMVSLSKLCGVSLEKKVFSKRFTSNFRYILYLRFDVNVNVLRKPFSFLWNTIYCGCGDLQGKKKISLRQ